MNRFVYHFRIIDKFNSSPEELDKTVKSLMKKVASEMGWHDTGAYRIYQKPETLSDGSIEHFVVAEYVTLDSHERPSCLTNESKEYFTKKTKFVGMLSFGSRLEDFKDIILRDGAFEDEEPRKYKYRITVEEVEK